MDIRLNPGINSLTNNNILVRDMVISRPPCLLVAAMEQLY